MLIAAAGTGSVSPRGTPTDPLAPCVCVFAGFSSQDADRLRDQLHADGALISGSLPENTWLVLASPDSLRSAGYRPHAVVRHPWQCLLAAGQAWLALGAATPTNPAAGVVPCIACVGWDPRRGGPVMRWQKLVPACSVATRRCWSHQCASWQQVGNTQIVL